MHYEGNIIRPPSEANSILLQVTTGCSRNKCAFCGAYKDKKFKIKSYRRILDDIFFASKYCTNQNKIFLCDGDVLTIPQKILINILNEIRKKLPWVRRIGTYANVKSLQMKSFNDLKKLKNLGLKIFYVGVETGDDKTLYDINKGIDSIKILDLCQQVSMAKIKLSLTILLGIAGPKRSLIHAKETGKLLSAIDPQYIGALTLILVPGTKMYNEYKSGTFTLLEPEEILYELRTIIENTNLSKGLFHANHASNYLPIRAILPENKMETLKKIDAALAGKISLKSEKLRGL